MAREKPLVLLTGATGYIGGRLLPLLERRGFSLRCLARRPEHLRPRAASTTEVVVETSLPLKHYRPPSRASIRPIT